MGRHHDGLITLHDGQFTLAMRGNWINVSTLQAAAQPLPVLGFLTLADTLPLIQQLALNSDHPMAEKWADVGVVVAQQDEFFRALKAPGIAERLPGDIGRRARLAEHGGILGEVDYLPGIWLHRDLVLPFATWITARRAAVKKTPLVAFLEKHLPGATKNVKLDTEKPEPVASTFAGEVSKQMLDELERVDRILMADGLSATERSDVLRARVDLMQGV
ncbi:MAG TPA: hypothetical protein VF671_13305 [Pseudomonas sp.]|jgi:hypothetical protein|uniref:hypothetical protein n=1 Tax=Pseudomonas sp. TaxID=306 RepID=UPI002ED7CB69